MDRLYLKKGSGKKTRYVEAGYQYTPDLYDGVWVVQETKSGSSTKGVAYRVSDVPNPVEIGISAALIGAFEEDLVAMIAAVFSKGEIHRDFKLTKSEKEIQAKDPLLYNISYYDLVQLFVTRIDTILQDMRKKARRIQYRVSETATWLLLEDFKYNWKRRYVVPVDTELDLREQREEVRKSILAFYWNCSMNLNIELPTEIIYRCGFTPEEINERTIKETKEVIADPWQNK